MEFVLKEAGLEAQVKMDAIAVQGVWINFPAGVIQSGRQNAAAMLYLTALSSAEKIRKRKTTEEEKVNILKDIEKRLIEEDAEDMILVLSM